MLIFLLTKIWVMNFADVWTGIFKLNISIPPESQSSPFVSLGPEMPIQSWDPDLPQKIGT